MRKNVGVISNFLVIMIAFYILPLIFPEDRLGTLILTPILCFGAAFVFSWRRGFAWWYVVLVALLFLPCVFLYYNESAWGYTIIYAVFALVGSFFGNLMPKKRN